MKKHLVLIMNVLLVLVILGGVFYAMYRASLMSQTPDDTVSTVDEVATKDEETVFEPMLSIGIIQHNNIPNYNNVYQGFIAQLAANGYINNNNIYLDYVVEEDNKKCKDAIQRFIDEDYDLIFSIGPYATKLAASMTDEIPVVFGAVAEPEQEEFVDSNEVPGGNVTGVSDYAPCFEQIDSIKLMFPDTKMIGAIYQATNEESVTQALIGEKEAQTEHVDIKYKKYPVTSSDEITEALEEMYNDGVEVIYAPVDSFITKNLKIVVNFSYDFDIPIVCGNTAMLEKGCFSTCIINYPSIGGRAGEMALSILLDGADPAKIPIAYIYDSYLHINESAMKKLSVELSDEILETAIIE